MDLHHARIALDRRQRRLDLRAEYGVGRRTVPAAEDEQEGAPGRLPGVELAADQAAGACRLQPAGRRVPARQRAATQQPDHGESEKQRRNYQRAPAPPVYESTPCCEHRSPLLVAGRPCPQLNSGFGYSTSELLASARCGTSPGTRAESSQRL